MIVFDIVANGEVKETLVPTNQRLREMRDYLYDRLPELKAKYGEIEVYRRFTQMGA
jgi:uroporphyrinogen-III synthase